VLPKTPVIITTVISKRKKVPMDNIKIVLTEEEVRAKMDSITKELSRQERRLAAHRLPQWSELDQDKG
jgi:hypothetical protein